MEKVFLRKLAFILAPILVVLLFSIFLWDFFAEPPEKIFGNLNFFQAALLQEPEPIIDLQKQESLNKSEPAPAPKLTPELIQESLGLQDQLDDIAEKIDIIEAQVKDLIKEQEVEPLKEDLEVELEVIEDKENKKDEEEEGEDAEIKEEPKQIKQKTNSSPSPTIYPKVLISEAQISSENDEKQEFIELYNPNSQSIDLTGWYLHKKTANSPSWSTFASKNLFNGKTIPANGYFLIARTGYYLASADIFVDSSITDDNSFAFKNPNGDVSDKLGFGNAQDPELLASIASENGQSIGRKLFDDGSERDTDNNFFDFELQIPTPRMKNITYIAQVEPPAPVLNNILINEVQVEGESVNDDWVELYNPNDVAVSLSGWSIQRASSTGNISRVKNFDNDAIILPKEYFLIVRNSANEGLLALADMTCSDLNLTSEFGSGATLYIVKKQDTIDNGADSDIVDKVGYGLAKDYEILPSLKPSAGKTTGRKWDDLLQTYLDTDNNSDDFEVQAPTPKQKNTAWIEPPPEPKDTTPPEVVFLLNAVQSQLNFTLNFEITDPDPLDGVTPSGLANYIFRWQEEGNNWQEDAEQFVASLAYHKAEREFLGESGKTYFFQITARDLLGNDSGWLPNPPALTIVSASDSPVVSLVVINEVQVNPTGQRFVELYNSNSQDIDLTGYYIQRKTKSGASFASFVSSPNFEGKTILANGYFLISRELENSDILLDITLSDNNLLVLKNPAGEILDKLGFGNAQDFETAPAQNPLEGQSITRTRGADTDNNSADFTSSDIPTPGRP